MKGKGEVMTATALIGNASIKAAWAFTGTVAKFTALTGAGTSAVSGLPADGQADLLVMAAVILGTALLLKAVTTIALFVITGRRRESITLLLGHPYVKSCRQLADLPGSMPGRIP